MARTGAKADDVGALTKGTLPTWSSMDIPGVQI